MKTLYYNGEIYLDHRNFTDFLLVENGQIQDPDGQCAEYWLSLCDNAVDLKGRTVVPGFNDAHLHLASVGELMEALTLNDADSIETVVALGRKYLTEHPTSTLIGRGWNEDLFTSGDLRPLTRWDLDRISLDVPIVFTRVCGHVAVCNTAALVELGIDAHTRVEEGEILKTPTGELNGRFTENALTLFKPFFENKTVADRKRALLKAMAYANENGITAVQSNDIMAPEHTVYFDILKALKAEKRLTLRYTHQFNFQQLSDFEHYLRTEQSSTSYDERWLSKGALKLYKDGSLGGRTALLRAPYADAPETRGVDALEDARFERLCRLAHENGIQIITHAIGDGAVEKCIDVYAKLNGGTKNPLRHGIVHCQITDDALLKRIHTHHITVFFQPIFIDYDHRIVSKRVGEALASTSYACGHMARNGTAIAFSTDAPVEDLNPFRNLYCAVTRKGLKPTDCTVYRPEECLSVSEAVDAYTLGSAVVDGKDTWLGRLYPGYAADFAVLSHPIFTASPEVLKTTQALLTVVDGREVYRSDTW
ncbi:amidohydrolase [Fusibacter sp. JL298sf-3]